VDAHSTNELAIYAFLLGIPIVAVSYSPAGVHPWLAHCAQVTVNSPESVQEILDSFAPATPNIAPSEEPCLPTEEPEEAPSYEYTCEEGHSFTSDRILSVCVVEDCGAEGVAECGAVVCRT
jgi:hypothetical protein